MPQFTKAPLKPIISKRFHVRGQVSIYIGTLCSYMQQACIYTVLYVGKFWRGEILLNCQPFTKFFKFSPKFSHVWHIRSYVLFGMACIIILLVLLFNSFLSQQLNNGIRKPFWLKEDPDTLNPMGLWYREMALLNECFLPTWWKVMITNGSAHPKSALQVCIADPCLILTLHWFIVAMN